MVIGSAHDVLPLVTRVVVRELVAFVSLEVVRLLSNSLSTRVHLVIVSCIAVIGVASTDVLWMMLLEVVLLPSSANSIAHETILNLILLLLRKQALEVAIIRSRCTGSLNPRALLLLPGFGSLCQRLALHWVLREHAIRVKEVTQVRHVGPRHVKIHGGALIILVMVQLCMLRVKQADLVR